MTIDEFWTLIEGLEPASFDMEAKARRLTAALSALPAGELRDFADHYWACRDRAYHWPLWDAAAVMYGGCGDDAFMDFSSSLITFGRAVFERALADPDSLAELPAPVPKESGIYAAIHAVVERVLGSDDRPAEPRPGEPTGKSIEQEEDYETLGAVRFPRLSAQREQRINAVSAPKKCWWKPW